MKEFADKAELTDEELEQVVGGDATTNDGSIFTGHVMLNDAQQGNYYYAVCWNKWIYGRLEAVVSTTAGQKKLKFTVVESHGFNDNIITGTWSLFITRTKA